MLEKVSVERLFDRIFLAGEPRGQRDRDLHTPLAARRRVHLDLSGVANPRDILDHDAPDRIGA